MSGDICTDDRFELIANAKAKLLECTNIESSQDEVAVLDSILFRCWQMGWLDNLREGNSRYAKLFGTPERAAQTLANLNCDGSGCDGCSFDDMICDLGGDALLEWLRGDAE